MFIVLEGSDGSGKTTQFKLLAERLRAAGHDTDIFEFPRYSEPSSYFIQRYLDGEYGPASEISPYTASLFYALDRFEAAPLIRQSLADGKIVLADRYAGSNMAHQGAKFSRSGEQRGFFVWEDSLEYQLLGVPRPTINLFLRVPAEVSHRLIKQRNISYDQHEADIEHLRKTVSTFDTLCQLFPKDFKPIECTNGGKLRSITEINNRIWEVLKPLLPKPSHPGHSSVINLSDKPKRADRQEIVEPIKNTAKNDAGFDGSFEIKDISLLALNNLQGQGLKIDYQIKWPPAGSKPRLNYYIPAEFSPKLSEKYKKTLDRLAELSRKLNESLPSADKKSAAHVVPLAALVDAKISGSRESTSQLLSKALSTELSELRQITKQTRTQLKEPQALKQLIKQIADTRLGGNSAAFDQPVKLLSSSPRNELDLLVDCLYPYSNLGREEIAAEIDSWTYEQKAKALKTACSSDTGVVLKKVHYLFDVVDNLIGLESLAKLLEPEETQVQPPTPRYGYQIPSGIEKAGLDETYIECFDLSLELYSDIQAAGLERLAGYAVLLGHRQRWQFSTNGELVFEYDSSRAFGADTLKQLREQIAEVHPLIAQTMSQRLSSNELENTQKAQNVPRGSVKNRPRKSRGTKSKK